jgi:arginase
MLWFDAHGDFNTPETTRSGYLGGMPVAVSTGLCLQRIRRQIGLEPALDVNDVVLAGVRDTDPEEQALIEEQRLTGVPVEDLTGDRNKLRSEMERLVERCDAIYVHVDLDVIDPEEAPGMNFPVPGGPGVAALGESLALCLSYGKASALGIASYNAPKDEQGRTLAGVLRLIERALRGLGERC